MQKSKFIKEPTKENPIEIIYKKQKMNPKRPNHVEMCEVIDTMPLNGGKNSFKRQVVVVGSVPIDYK